MQTTQVADFGTDRKPVYDFLIYVISQRFRVIASRDVLVKFSLLTGTASQITRLE